MFLSLNIFALSGVLIGVTSGLMAILMFVLGKSRLHYLWGIFCISVFTWGLGAYMIATTSNIIQADLWWRITHVGVIFIPILFLHFVYEFLGLKRKITLLLVYFIGAFFLITNLSGDLFIANMRWVFNQFYYDSPPGIIYPAFTAFFFGLTAYSHFLLWQAHKTTDNILKKTRIKYFFLGMLISFSGGGLSFLPVYGIDFYPVLNTLVFAYPVIIAYAILKHQLFNIKVVATQLLTFLLWVLILIRTLLSETPQDWLLNGGLFLATVVLGIFLIRSVIKEVHSREEIEKLAMNLEKANKRLKELDRMKSEFVSIASHQLRAPLTAIKGYASLILEGSYGSVSNSVKEGTQRIFDASQLMISSVEDFLNVSRIEQGRMNYRFDETDIAEIAKTVVTELKLIADKKKLVLTYSDDKSPPYMSRVDLGKIKQMITNLVDNAVKYTPHGKIGVRITKNIQQGKIRIAIADTGVGMSKETISKVFEKFVRSRNAHEVNVSGTGLGLYVAYQIIKAHKGRIWAESEGEGRGSIFFVELNLSKT